MYYLQPQVVIGKDDGYQLTAVQSIPKALLMKSLDKQ